MDLSAINPAVLIASLMVAAVPIMLAAIGELVVEKAGVLNLGVEGMMIMGAVCGLAIAVETQSPVVGFIAAAAGGAALSLIFAFLTQVLLANQVATGLALTLFGLGLSSLIGQGYVGIKPPPTPRLDFGPLTDIPALGTILFHHDPMVYLSILIIAAVWAPVLSMPGRITIFVAGLTTYGLTFFATPSQDSSSYWHRVFAIATFVLMSAWPLFSMRFDRSYPWIVRPVAATTAARRSPCRWRFQGCSGPTARRRAGRAGAACTGPRPRK